MLQKSEHDNSCAQNNVVFDHMNTNRIEVRVNGYKYPQENFKCDFSDANEDYSNAYQRFLQDINIKMLMKTTRRAALVFLDERKRRDYIYIWTMR